MPKAKTAWVDFKEIKARVSIVQILERYGILETLQKSGNGDRLSGACPIHGGTNTTHFRASISKNCWNCFGKCQSGGNVIDFVSKKEELSFREAAILIQKWFMGEHEETPSPQVKERNEASKVDEKPEASESRSTPAPMENAKITSEETMENPPLNFSLAHLDSEHEYLRERGLTPESIAAFGLGYCGKGLLRGYIAIPIHNTAGELVAYAGRWPGTPPAGHAKYKLPNGFKKSLEIYNLHRAMLSDQDAPLVIVEGFFDCIKIHQAGHERVVALMGSSLSESQENLILENADPDRGVVVFLDNDEAGRKAQSEILCRLARHVFVKSLFADGEGRQPEHLSPEEVRSLLPMIGE